MRGLPAPIHYLNQSHWWDSVALTWEQFHKILFCITSLKSVLLKLLPPKDVHCSAISRHSVDYRAVLDFWLISSYILVEQIMLFKCENSRILWHFHCVESKPHGNDFSSSLEDSLAVMLINFAFSNSNKGHFIYFLDITHKTQPSVI